MQILEKHRGKRDDKADTMVFQGKIARESRGARNVNDVWTIERRDGHCHRVAMSRLCKERRKETCAV